MPEPRRRITQDEAPELLAHWRASEQLLREWCAENGVVGRSLHQRSDRLPQPAAIRLAEPARPGRATPEPLRLTLDWVVIDLPDVNIDQAPGCRLWCRHVDPDLGRPGEAFARRSTPSAPPVRAEGRAGENDALLVTPVRRPPLPRPEPCLPTPPFGPQSESSAAMRAARACPRP